jgi:hypothetical protein
LPAGNVLISSTTRLENILLLNEENVDFLNTLEEYLERLANKDIFSIQSLAEVIVKFSQAYTEQVQDLLVYGVLQFTFRVIFFKTVCGLGYFNPFADLLLYIG